MLFVVCVYPGGHVPVHAGSALTAVLLHNPCCFRKAQARFAVFMFGCFAASAAERWISLSTHSMSEWALIAIQPSGCVHPLPVLKWVRANMVMCADMCVDMCTGRATLYTACVCCDAPVVAAV